jgi:hypothetical protein
LGWKLLSFPSKRKTLPKSRVHTYFFPQISTEKVTDFADIGGRVS